MADERQILGLSNASNRNLENALTLHKTEDNLYQILHIHLPLHKFIFCDITMIDLLPYRKSYICTRARATTSVTILVLLVQQCIHFIKCTSQKILSKK